MKTKISHLGRSTVSVILAVMMLLSTMLIGTVSTVNATSNKFTEGETIYLDLSDFTHWEDGTPTPSMYAYFYDYNTKDLVGDKIPATKVTDHIYSVTVPNANCGYIQFQRGDWNKTAEHDADTKGTNNCVKVSNWDGSSSWSTYSGGSTTEKNYYVAGQKELINGTAEWTPKQELDKMTYSDTDGYYSITYTDKTPGTYQFKITDNNSEWYGYDAFTVENGNGCTVGESDEKYKNISVTFNKKSNVTIKFNIDSRNQKHLYVIAESAFPKVADSVALTASSETVKVGDSVTLTAVADNPASANLTYKFTKTSGGDATVVQDNDKLTVTPTAAGTYKYTVTVSADGYSPVTSNEVSFTVTDSVTYYLGGRVAQNSENSDWIAPDSTDNTSCKFVKTETDGLYKYESNQTPAAWSETRNNLLQYFYVRTSLGGALYYGNDESSDDALALTAQGQKANLAEIKNTDIKNLIYIKSNDTSTKATFWLDTRNNKYKLWYTTTLPHNVIVANGVSASVDKKTATAGETVTVTATPENGKVLDTVTVVGKDSTPIETTVSGNTATFIMPDQDVTVKEVTFRTAETYTVKFSSSNETFGTVSATNGTTSLNSDTKVTEGDTVTFTAKPKEGYALSGWTVNNASVSPTTNPYTITVQKDTTVVANFKEMTGTLSGYYLLCGTGATFKADSYTHVPLYTNEDGVFYADFDVAKDSIPKSKDYFIIFSTKEDTSGIIVDSNNVTVNAVNKNGFSLSDYNENVQNSSGGTNNVKFAKVYIDKDEVTGFTIKITNLDLTNKKITYSAEPTFDVAPADTVEITAKDGTIRGTTATIADLGNTTIEVTTPEGKTLKATDSFSNKAQTVKKVPDKSKVKVTTTIDESKTFAGVSGSGYYVKGFSINGIFGGVLSQSEGKSHDSDVYTFEFTVNQELYNETKLEITPVYFLKDDSNCVYFYIENYDSAKQIWGNTPSCYVYYGSGTTTLEALGYYPGQPMVDYNGSIFTQIPKYIDNGGTQVDITGMTLNNYVWDDVHSAYNGKNQREDNAQTYDYDDFVKIADSGVNAENIIYRFKYNEHNNVPGATLDTSDTDADGWEVFLDYQNYPTDIFGTRIGDEKLDYKDTNSVTSKDNCLSIISDGYQTNYIGQYATAWSIYKKTGEKVATIPSSALLYALDKTEKQMTDAIELGTTPGDFLPGKEDRDTYWETFKTLYEKYKGFYAQINFEAAIKQGPDVGNRLDGRWYYTKSSQDITGEIKIQYANTLDDYNKVGGFNEDTFETDSSIIGKTTGASAYFTDPENKVRKLNTTADNTQDYKFEVTATPSTAAYTFVGWYRLIDGDYKAINPSNMSSLTGAVTRNSDVTLVARYIKTPGGSMTFQHSLYKGENAGGGKATTEIQVVVKNSEGKLLYDSHKIPGTASIDKTKITELAKQSGLTVTVTLYTTTKNLYDFKGYYSAENTPVTKPFTDGFTKEVTGTRKEGLITTSVYTFSFNEYYQKYAKILTASDAGTVYYNFYSDITSIKVPYKVQFSYKDRMEKQKYYNKAGYVDPENTSSYTIVEDGKNVKVTLENSFILTLAPYESNFAKDLTWDENSIRNTAFDSSLDSSIASAVVNSTQSDKKIHLNVFLDKNTKRPTSRDNENGVFEFFTKDGLFEFPYGSVFYEKKPDGTYNYDITAPKTYEGKQFMYWAIYSDSRCRNEDLVIKAYNSEGHFSYVAYDNCWIVPVYGESSTPVASVKDVSTSTQFMEVTRNQWTADKNSNFEGFNADSMTTLDKADDFIKIKGEDKLYADFVLNFFYNGKQLSVFDPYSKNVNVGVLIQRLDLDENETGTGYITDLDYYANKKFTTEQLDAAEKDAIDKITTGDSVIKSVKQPIANSKLDNKNRLHYYTIFNNVKGNNNCVFRLYTYIQYTNASGETAVQLSNPVYFTFYDIANKS